MKVYLKQKTESKEDLSPKTILSYAVKEEAAVELAGVLLHKAGSPLELLSIPAEELTAPDEMTENAAILLRLTAACARRYWMDVYRKDLSLSNPDAIVGYLSALYLDINVEEVYLLCFDKNGTFLGEELLSHGGFASAAIDHRKLLRLVMEQEAKTVILSHNHPSGEPDASRADYEASKKIADLLSLVDCSLYDHLIISRNEYESLFGAVQAE